jgi:hypothetical protein
MHSGEDRTSGFVSNVFLWAMVFQVLSLAAAGCGGTIRQRTGPDGGTDAAVHDSGDPFGDGGGSVDGGGTGNDGGSGVDGGGTGCTGTGPAYVHGDLWPYWHNGRVACQPQHKWWWICETRLGAGNCGPEEQRFWDCWNATGDFPPTSWGADSTPTPHSANYGVCQPHHWPEKNLPAVRPGNPVPCDTTTYDYSLLRTADPFYGVDWWTGTTGMRHLTVKVYAASVDPLASEGLADGIVNLSTHPGERDAFMDGLSNHSYPGHVRNGGCVPQLTGDPESPYPDQNFGAFFWLEVPTDRRVTIGATWTGRVGGDVGDGCLLPLYGFPSNFAVHSVDGKPWFILNPCWDILYDVQLEPGRHYVWDVHGFRLLPDCNGPPQHLLDIVPANERPPFADGTCSSM